MAPKSREVGIRLSVKDKEIAERALKQFGKEGQAALRSDHDVEPFADHPVHVG